MPYSFVAWLLLPSLVVARSELPMQPKLYRFIVDAGRLGAALAAMLTRFGLDTAACSPSVARARMRALSTHARTAIDATPFVVVAADWYLVQVTPVHPAPAPPALAVPAAFLHIDLEMMLEPDDGLGTLGAFEALAQRRVTFADRLAPSGPLVVLISALTERAFSSLGGAMRTALLTAGGAAVGTELTRLFKLAMPDTITARYQPGLLGILALAERLSVGMGTRAPPPLGGDDLTTAIEHSPTLTTVLCSGEALPAAEMARGVQMMGRAAGIDGALDVAKLAAVEDAISFLRDRLGRGDLGPPRGARAMGHSS